MLKRRLSGRGMHLEFCHPQYPTPIITSPIQEIREPRMHQLRDQCAGLDRAVNSVLPALPNWVD